MKLLYAKLVNYIGIYNGMNLSYIEIDFTKCKNNIVLIAGMNGSGKSTLQNALTILPDSNTDILPNVNGEKYITLGDGIDIYEIYISYPWNNNSRGQTKAFIKKNGIELNTNGNIGSYKDIIFIEFVMDPNYTSLSQVSNTNKGIVSKTPAERKKYLSSILESVDVYNNMYKIFNKKSSIYNSYINK